MEITIPEQLAALSHPKRFDLFRLLMRRYPNSVPAGQIAEALGLRANTTSTYLTALRQADLIEQRRVGTSVQYTASLPHIRKLFGALMGDCCQNRPDICLPSSDFLSNDAAVVANPDKQLNALFICTGNSARSIMAEAILRAEGKGRFNAYSAGTNPAQAPHPEVLALLKNKSYDISKLTSKSLDRFSASDAPKMDFVFTVCDHAANEECPVWPGQPMSAHWGLPDPTLATGTEAQKKLAYQQAYGLLRNRICAFVNLPVQTLSRISLQHEVDDIGRMQAEGVAD